MDKWFLTASTGTEAVMTYDKFRHAGTRLARIISMNLKRNKRQRRMKEIKELNDDTKYTSDSSAFDKSSSPQNAGPSQSNVGEKDVSCLYVNSCTFQNCLGCRRLK